MDCFVYEFLFFVGNKTVFPGFSGYEENWGEGAVPSGLRKVYGETEFGNRKIFNFLFYLYYVYSSSHIISALLLHLFFHSCH